MKNKNNDIQETTFKIINRIKQSNDILAEIRNSITSDVKTFTTLSYIYEFLDENEYNSDKLNYKEKAILSTLQLYAIHKQGMSENTEPNTNEKINIGSSLHVLRENEPTSIEKRFNSMITSNSFEELAFHLRQLIKLLKANSDNGGKINYQILAKDLYFYQFTNSKKEVLLKWSRNFYQKVNKKKEGEEKNEKNK